MLALKNITKKYQGVTALNKVDFSLNYGEVRILLGKNGAGKSTLIKVINGSTRVDSGEIFIKHDRVTIHNPLDAFSYGISTVHQERTLIPELSVAENIYLGHWPKRSVFGVSQIDYKKMHDQVRYLLKKLKFEIDVSKKISNLNVAQQQMVEIAKAISCNPSILILDEPTSALTSKEVETLHVAVLSLAESKTAILYVTHRLHEIASIADTISVLRDGCHVGTILKKEATPGVIARMMIGSNWNQKRKKLPYKNDHQSRYSSQSKYVLHASRLSTKNGLKNISFHLHKGEVLGIAGLLGSGRTKLMRTLFGLNRFDSGRLYIGGKEILFFSPGEMKRHGVAFIPEDRKKEGLILNLSVSNNISITSLSKLKSYGMISFAKEKSLIGKVIGNMMIKTADQEIPVSTLSGGNQQKIVLGKWMAINPKIFLMDEPTQGIDIQAKDQIFYLIRKLADQGSAVIFTSCEIEEVMNISDRVMLLKNGQLLADNINPRNTSIEKILKILLKSEKPIKEEVHR